jgi:hypothetical protein
MPDQIFHPIETTLGVLSGRDALFLDQIEMDIQQGVLQLKGTINGALLAKSLNRDIAYVLTFFGVLALQLIELDSWDNCATSSFDEVWHSRWQVQLGGKVTPDHRHYLVQTYDDVIEVVCQRFDLMIEDEG